MTTASMQPKRKQGSIIVTAGVLGSITASLLHVFTENPKDILRFFVILGVTLFLIFFAYCWGEKIYIYINKYEKPISYISFTIFILLIISIAFFRFVLQ